jgi:GT2 family glycosyltransferase
MVIDVSVVIVNWNTKTLLLDCIRSLYDTTLTRRMEVIVVDNASTDGSVEAVEHCFPNVTMICNDMNLGFAKANNIGIGASSGKYVCLVNSDIKVLDGCIESMCAYMNTHPAIGLLGPQILNKDLSLQSSCGELPSVKSSLMQALMLDKLLPRLRYCRNRFMDDFDHRTLRHVETLSGCFLMARREALDQVGPLDERFFFYAEDVDWCKRFHNAGWPLVFYPGGRAIHYGGASSAAAPTKFLIEMERANMQYWRKHHSWIANQTVAAITIAHYWLRIWIWAMIYLFRPSSSIARHMIRKYIACACWLSGFDRIGHQKAR